MTEHPAAREPAPLVDVPPVVRAAAGSAAQLPVVVTNAAPEPRELVVLAVGVDATWLPNPVRTRTLVPGESETVVLPLTPAAGTLPARYPVAVTVQAFLPGSGRGAGGPSGMGDTALVVNPRAQVELVVTPERSSAVRGQRVLAVVRNGGAADITVDLDTTTTKGLEARLRRRQVDVPAGGETRVKGRLVLTRPRLVGGAVQHSWTVTATTAEVARQVRGTLQQRAVLGPAWVKAIALVAVVAVWATAAVVLVPRFADRFTGQDEETATVTADEGDGDGGQDGGDGGGGSDGGGGAGGGDADGGGGSVTVTRASSPATPKGLQLNGTVTADDPAGVSVTLEPTTLVAQDAQDAQLPAALVSLVSSTTGKTPQSALLLRAPDRLPTSRTATTTDDGTWSFPDVSSPGYYLATFSKPGYETQRHVIDSSTADPTEPLEVELTPGDGVLSGRVTGPGGPLGAATVTISDGTSTLTTSSASRDRVGTWSVTGLSTPASYLVQVSQFGLGTESRLVELGPGGEATADVRLQPGQAALVGVVKGRGAEGRHGGLGGVTVSVTDDQGAVRTATTVTKDNLEGRYQLSGLPSPGTYTVALSRDGYQTETSRLTLRDGQALARLDAQLVAATGVVGGTVRGKTDDGGREPLLGAGLTLSNGTHTYKTRSTARSGADDQPAGGFQFTGVKPGTYLLTTEVYEYETSVLTVQVGAGRLSTANPLLRKRKLGELDATSTIKGIAVQAGSGQPLPPCVPEDTECYKATVGIQTEDGGVVQVSDTFGPSEEYVLDEIPPGLHTVTAIGPGWEEGRVKVQVPVDQTVIAAPIELSRAPVIRGDVSVAVGDTHPDSETCVWAVPLGASLDVGSCADAMAQDRCRSPNAVFDVSVTGPVCALVGRDAGGRGAYSIQPRRPGTFLLVAKSTDTEYLDRSPTETPPLEVTVARNQTVEQDVVLDRRPRVTVTVSRPTDRHTLRLVDGAEVRLTGASTRTGTTDHTGRVRFTTLALGTHAVTASTGNLATPEPYPLALEANEDAAVSLVLGEELGQTTGRVVTVGGTPSGFVEGATVTVTGTVRYDDGTPVPGTVTVTSHADADGSDLDGDNDGCFALLGRGQETPAPMGECAAFGDAHASVPFVSRWAELRVAAPGYQDLVRTQMELGGFLDPPLELEPLAVPFSGTIAALPTGTHPFEQAAFTVTSPTTSTSSITLQSAADGTLTWKDTRYDTTNRIRPGTYTVTASLSGYVGDSATFTCSAGADCVLPPDLQLRELGSLTVRTVHGTSPVDGATVQLFVNGATQPTTPSSTSGNSATFTGLVPGASYIVNVKAAGYRFGAGTLTCTPAGTAEAPIAVEAGTETVCQSDLTKLATLAGTLKGLLATGPDVVDDSTPTRLLASTEVWAARCTGTDTVGSPAVTYCTGVETARFTATTDANGAFRIVGTNQREGITEGTWLVGTSVAGWALPRVAGAPTSAPAGRVVTVAAADYGQEVASDLSLFANPVNLSVGLLDQYGKAIKDATVQLWLGDTKVADGVKTANGNSTTWKFDGTIPGFYDVVVTGTGLVTTAYEIEVRVGQTTQSETVTVSRGVSVIQGTVVGDDRPDGLAGAAVRIVSCTAGLATCGTDPATGADGEPMTTTTSADGTFVIDTVPNGRYSVVASLIGYGRKQTAPMEVRHTGAPPGSVAFTLDHTSRNVTVELDPSVASDDLTGAEVSLAPVAGDAYGNVAPAAQTVSGTSTTFNQLRFGCWTLEVTLPDGHHGDITLPAPVTNTALDCSGHVVVPPAPSDTDITVTVRVVERELHLEVTATPLPGHPSPGKAVIDGGPLSGLEVVPGTGPVSVWLGPGTHRLTATPGIADPANPEVPLDFWGSAERTVTIGTNPTNPDPVEVDLLLEEHPADVTFGFAKVLAEDQKPARLVLLVPPGQTASVPAEYAGGAVDITDGEVTLMLPWGPWHVEVHLQDGSRLPVDTNGDPQSYAIVIDDVTEAFAIPEVVPAAP